MNAPVEIRLPRLLRAYVVAFSVFWCGGVGAGFVASFRAGSPTAAVPVLMLAFGGFVFVRTFQLGVLAQRNRLVVRNAWNSRSIAKGDVEGFGLGSGPMGQPFMKCVHVLLRDGTVLTLDATARPTFIPRADRRLTGQLQALERWMTCQRPSRCPRWWPSKSPRPSG